jgi:hypothetical protein
MEQEQTTTTETPEKQHQQPQYDNQLNNMKVTNQNSSLNIMIYLMSIAQKRGAFTIQESAKLWECIEIFKPDT